MYSETTFKEQQQFRQVWLWTLLLVINALFIVGTIRQVYLGKSFGNNPSSNFKLVSLTIMVLGILLLFVFMRLETAIDTIGVHYRFYPFHRKMRTIEWNRISKAYTRKYNPIGEYGGWGIRSGIFGSGKALNISGNKGLQLIYDNNQKLLLGTQKLNELETILQQLGKTN
ncbi:MAG TPA: hypothetical protein PLM55_05475 [Chitinophagales bacterium]|nr:hypothetical protein [Chitinophagales bacterium]